MMQFEVDGAQDPLANMPIQLSMIQAARGQRSFRAYFERAQSAVVVFGTGDLDPLVHDAGLEQLIVSLELQLGK